MLDLHNVLKEPWEKYQKRQLSQIVKSIPPERREALLREIGARAALTDVQSPALLQAALRLLGRTK